MSCFCANKQYWSVIGCRYFLVSTNYYLYGETLFSHFKENFLVDAFLQPLAAHHRFVSFLLYVIGFIFFVMNLKKGHYKFQFLQFFWTHMTLLIVVIQSHFILNNILDGLVWFILPVTLVICNDMCAYLGGFFFGRTRLIRLSPKKTCMKYLIIISYSIVSSQWLFVCVYTKLCVRGRILIWLRMHSSILPNHLLVIDAFIISHMSSQSIYSYYISVYYYQFSNSKL